LNSFSEKPFWEKTLKNNKNTQITNIFNSNQEKLIN
jgi:hypothetical protein